MVERDTALSAGAEREARLRAAIEAAYREGWDDRNEAGDRSDKTRGEAWRQSRACEDAALSDTPAPAIGTGTRVEGLEEAAQVCEQAGARYALLSTPANAATTARALAAAIRALASREPGREGE
jgi:hypothetical protein